MAHVGGRGATGRVKIEINEEFATSAYTADAAVLVALVGQVLHVLVHILSLFSRIHAQIFGQS